MRSVSPDLKGPYWRPLIAENLRNIRWIVESALWIFAESGRDTTGVLLESLTVLHEGADRDLGELRSDADPRMGLAAGIALEVANGSRIPAIWKRNELSFV